MSRTQARYVCPAVGHMKIKNNGEHDIKVIIPIQAAAVGCRRENGGCSRIREVVAWLSSRLFARFFCGEGLHPTIVNC